MRKKLLALGLLLMLFLSSSCSDSGSTPSTPTAPPPQANCVATKDPLIVCVDVFNGYWSISGSVKNIGDGVARNVKITFYFYYNQTDTVPFASAFSYTTPSTLQPGQEGTYSIVKQILAATFYWTYKITWD